MSIRKKALHRLCIYFVLMLILFFLIWEGWRAFIVSESTVAFTNRSGIDVSIYNVTINGRSIYKGDRKDHGRNISPAEHGHFFDFFEPRGKVEMTVYFVGGGERFVASQYLDHRSGRCEFYCDITAQYKVRCVCDDIFDIPR